MGGAGTRWVPPPDPLCHGRYNISQLEQWLRAQGLQHSGAREMLEPLVQAAQLLQVKKATEEDAGAICSLCTVLSPQQVPGRGLGVTLWGCSAPVGWDLGQGGHGAPPMSLQVVKILRAYTPAAGLEERVSPDFISTVEVSGDLSPRLCPHFAVPILLPPCCTPCPLQKRLQEQQQGGPSQLLVDTSHLFPVNLPFVASPVHLDEIRIPDTMDLAFLLRL